MARTTLNQRSFSAGEISPELYGRSDVAKYATALKTCRNFFLTKSGTLKNMPGTQFVQAVKDSTNTTRLLPFKFSLSQQYVLELGHGTGVAPTVGYLRVYQNGAPAIFGTINAWSNATVYKVGDTASRSGVNYYCVLAHTNHQPPNATYWYALASNQIDIPTPWQYFDLALLRYAQSFDVMTLVHNLYKPYELKRILDSIGQVTFVLAQAQFAPSIIPTNTVFNGNATAFGINEYNYKITVQDLVTREESFPMPTGITAVDEVQKIDVPADWDPANLLLTQGKMKITFDGHTTADLLFSETNGSFQTKLDTTFGAGNVVLISDGPNHFPFEDMKLAGTPLRIEFKGTYANAPQPLATIAITQAFGDAFVNPLTDPGPFIEDQLGASAAAGITAISYNSTLNVQLTTNRNHQLTDGDQIIIFGTGISQLDNRVFNVVVTSPTVVQIPTDPTNYDTPPSPVTGYLQATAIKIFGANDPTSASPNILTILKNGTLPQAYLPFNVRYNVYRGIGGVYGYIGSTQGYSFRDTGIPPDSTIQPPNYIAIFLTTGNYPSAVTYYQQRRIFFATDNQPQGIFASAIGKYSTFATKDPIQPDDPILDNAASNQLTQIFDVADAGFMVLMTDKGPLVVAGSQSGQFTPEEQNIRPQVWAGAAKTPRPIQIIKNIIYVQAENISIRDLQIQTTPYYTFIADSEEVTSFADHLFDGFTISEWDYSQFPDSIVWIIRNDGTLIGLTYVHEQKITAFHRHDTLGDYKSVACIQEGNEVVVYVIVERTINSNVVKYVERFYTRKFTDVTVDAVFLHCAGTYDGHSLIPQGGDPTAITFSGSTYQFGDNVTLTSSYGSTFVNGDVGKQWNFKDSDGNIARVKITARTNGGLATGTFFEVCPTAMQGGTFTDIAVAASTITGLTWLEGQEVAVFADGYVVANPNDNEFDVLTVSSGSITLSDKYSVVHVGLPYYSDIQTLDIDNPNEETQTDKRIIVKKVTTKVDKTADFWIGPTIPASGVDGMRRPKIREYEGYTYPDSLFTGIAPLPIAGKFDFGGSFGLRNLSPTPITVLQLAALVEIQGAK
jgi:hypothetical protein